MPDWQLELQQALAGRGCPGSRSQASGFPEERAGGAGWGGKLRAPMTSKAPALRSRA